MPRMCLIAFAACLAVIADADSRRYDAALAKKIAAAVREQVQGADGGSFLLYPEEKVREEQRRKLGAESENVYGTGFLDQDQMVKRRYAEIGLHQGPERQEYEGVTVPSRRLTDQEYTEAGTPLTLANTRPIRIVANYDMLDEAKVEKYAFCFNVGDWFKNGSPSGSEPPADSVPTCLRPAVSEGYESDCWGVCEERDVITDASAECMKNEMDAVLPIIGEFLRVPILKGNKLKLTVSEGSYISYYHSIGQGGSTCFADCKKTSAKELKPNMLDSYCANGVDGDVIVFLKRGIAVDGVGGFGGSCAKDQYGRSIGAVFNWVSQCESAVAARPAGWRASAVDEMAFRETLRSSSTVKVAKERLSGSHGHTSQHLVVHEVMHGLGFSSDSWVQSGKVERKVFTDLDGTEDDVYAFRSDTRTHRMMQKYYGCDNDATRMPLMGWPSYGRDSHQSSRLVPEDVMSYSGGGAISALTLAMMEDTGVYLANYSAADAISYGKGQGCAYVDSRCEVRGDDLSVNGTAAPWRCGNVFTNGVWSNTWGMTTAPALAVWVPTNMFDPVGQDLVRGVAKCAKAGVECGTIACDDDGFNCAVQPLPLVEGMCNAECYASAGAAPLDLGDMDPPTLAERFHDWIPSGDMLWLMLVVAGTLFSVISLVLYILRCLTITIERTIFLSNTISVMGFFIGIAGAGAAGYAIQNIENFGMYVSEGRLKILFACGVALIVYCVAQIYIVRRKKREPAWTGGIEIAMLSQVALIALQLAAIGLALYWVQMVGKMPEQVEAADGGGRWRDHFFDESLAEMEHAACETYRTCCRDPNLISQTLADSGQLNSVNSTASGTCMSSPELAASSGAGGQLTVLDASQPGFCLALSGEVKFGMNGVATTASCSLLDSHVGGFSVDDCQKKFCESGLEGYQAFLVSLVDSARANAVPATILIAFTVTVQVLQLYFFNAIRKKAAEMVKNTPRGNYGGDYYDRPPAGGYGGQQQGNKNLGMYAVPAESQV